MKINLDLGQESGDMMSEPIERDEKYYPSFHFSNDEPLDIPHEGEMTIRYQKTSSSMSEDREGEKHYMCTVEVQKIVSVDGKGANPPSKRDRTAEENLDKLMSAKQKKSEGY